MSLELAPTSKTRWALVCCVSIACAGDAGPPAAMERPSVAVQVRPASEEQRAPSAGEDTPMPALPKIAAPAPLVEVALEAPGLVLDLRYAGPNNFTGARVPGYGRRVLWLHERAAAALERARQAALAKGFGLWIFDAYRPGRASAHFVEFARSSGNKHWVRDGYIAKRSAHGRGVAVDLSLFSLDTGELVDMGGKFDSFDEAAHTQNATGPARTHRLRLREIMQTAGFVPYAKEWWHFSLPNPDAPQLDVPLGGAPTHVPGCRAGPGAP